MIGVLCWFIFNKGQGEKGARITVTVDSVEYGTYDLSTDQTIPIQIDGETANVLTIENGKAKMTDADCPDQLCVHQSAIDRTNETIVCLPHKVVVTVEGAADGEFDTVAQ